MDAWTVLSASHVKFLSSTWRTRSGQFVDCERLPDQFHPKVNHPVWTTASAWPDTRSTFERAGGVALPHRAASLSSHGNAGRQAARPPAVAALRVHWQLTRVRSPPLTQSRLQQVSERRRRTRASAPLARRRRHEGGRASRSGASGLARSCGAQDPYFLTRDDRPVVAFLSLSSSRRSASNCRCSLICPRASLATLIWAGSLPLAR